MRTARRFAADASHELQTPLTAMRGMVEAWRLKARSVDDYQRDGGPICSAHRTLSSTLVRVCRLLALAEAGQVVDRRRLRRPGQALTQECSDIARAIAEGKRFA